VLSLVGSGSGGTTFFGFVVAFVLITEVVDVRLGLLAVVVMDVAVAVVFTLTVETVDETELRRGRDASSPGNSEAVLLKVDDASLC
jgi:predicted RND superfamily exporter protein